MGPSRIVGLIQSNFRFLIFTHDIQEEIRYGA